MAAGAAVTGKRSRDARSGLLHRRRLVGLGHAIPSVLLMFLALACASCQAAPSADAAPTTIHISGSTSMAPVLRELAEAYRKTRPHVQVEVLGNGSRAGLHELQAGTVDITAVSWKADDEETPKGLRAVPFARDGIAVVVHPSNRVAGSHAGSSTQPLSRRDSGLEGAWRIAP